MIDWIESAELLQLLELPHQIPSGVSIHVFTTYYKGIQVYIHLYIDSEILLLCQQCLNFSLGLFARHA